MARCNSILGNLFTSRHAERPRDSGGWQLVEPWRPSSDDRRHRWRLSGEQTPTTSCGQIQCLRFVPPLFYSFRRNVVHCLSKLVCLSASQRNTCERKNLGGSARDAQDVTYEYVSVGLFPFFSLSLCRSLREVNVFHSCFVLAGIACQTHACAPAACTSLVNVSCALLASMGAFFLPILSWLLFSPKEVV